MGYQGPAVFSPRKITSVVDSYHPQMCGSEIAAFKFTNASNNVGTANKAFYLPFTIAEAVTAYQLGVVHGAAVAGNYDMGIYLPSGAKVVLAGSTAGSGVSVWQWFNITDTILIPGLYYIGVSTDTNGATNRFQAIVAGTAMYWQIAGAFQELSAFPLPATATFAKSADTQLPWVGISLRATP